MYLISVWETSIPCVNMKHMFGTCAKHTYVCVYIYLTSWSHMYVYLASWSHMCVCPEHGCHTWIYYIYQVCVSRVYLVYMSRAHICIIYQSVRQNIWESREYRVPPGVSVGGNVYVAAGPNIPRPKNLPARVTPRPCRISPLPSVAPRQCAV